MERIIIQIVTADDITIEEFKVLEEALKKVTEDKDHKYSISDIKVYQERR